MPDIKPEEFWREKTDEELRTAASRLYTFTEDGQRAVCDELQRRGIPLPEQKPEPEPLKSLPAAILLAVFLGAIGMLYVRRFWLSLALVWGVLVLIGVPALIVPEGSLAEEFAGRLWIICLLALRFVLLPLWAVRRVREINRAAS